MKKLTVLIAMAASLSSCLGPAKINKWVAHHYDETTNAPAKKSADYFTVTSPLVTADIKPSTTKKRTKNLLPLLFYWQYDYQNTCTLNPAIPVNTFRSVAQTYANSKGLRQKLAGQKIELSVDKIPNAFLLNDRGHIIWVIYVFGWDVITFQPQGQALQVSYKLTKDGVETGSGVVAVPNTDKVLSLRLLQSIRKATYQYLDQYNASITLMSKIAMDKIITDINTKNTALLQ